MAGDWIPMREDLHEDPAVLTIAHRLNTRPEHVVGYCHRFWGWAGRNMSLTNGDNCPDVVPENEGQMSRFCPDAVLVGVPLSSIESVLNLPNFLSLLCEVGWLKYAESDESYDGKPVLTVPNFDRWLSQSAKSRVLATQKKRRQRCPDSVPVLSRKCPQKKGTREEKRREEYKKNPPNPPSGGLDDDFETFWSSFPRLRRTKKDKALEAWRKAVKRAKPAVIIAAAIEYADSPVGRGKYVQGPTPWLNGGCWNDDRLAWQRSDSGDVNALTPFGLGLTDDPNATEADL